MLVTVTLLLVSVWLLALLNLNRYLWSATLLILSAAVCMLELLPPPLGYILLTVASCGAIVLAIKPIRQKLVTKFIFGWFKKIMPPMSETEAQAIKAGDTWYEANLFAGSMDWNKFLAEPSYQLTQEEENFLNDQTEKLCAMLDDWQITHHDLDMPEKVWQYMRGEKFFALHIPKEYGGLGFSATANSTIVAKIATKSLTAAVTVMVPNSLGPAELLLKYGTNAQKEQYLYKLASGEHIPCFGLTGIEAGSDAGSIPDTGVVCYGKFGKQKNILGIKLNWNKRYITLAPVATVIGLAVKLHDPEGLLATKARGITVVLLPTNTPGVEIGRRHFPLNQPFMNGPTSGKDVFVPLDYIVGGQEMIGQGWTMLVECLAAGRGISLPALATAVGKQSFRTTGSYAKVRKQFNLSIGKFEGVAEAMAEIGGYTYMLEATRLLTLTAIDNGSKPSVITAIAKYHMTEMGRKVINHAMDIHGGRGIMLGPKNYLARAYQGIPISITVEGANILTRSLVIFGQGAIRCHPFVTQELQAAAHENSKVGLQNFDQALCAHIKYGMNNFARLVWHSITGLIFIAAPKNAKFASYYKKLSFYSIALAMTADIAMLTLGGTLKRRESLSARLGDVLSNLYMSAAVLKYFVDNKQADEDLPFVQWSIEHCLHEIHQAFEYFYHNFDNRFFANILKWIVFMCGRRELKPKDSYNKEISEAMMQQSEFKYSAADPSGTMEIALNNMLQAEPIMEKINLAIKRGLIANKLPFAELIASSISKGIINEVELEVLQKFEHSRIAAIMVNDFDNATLIRK
jgi:acyl-CoA dehydrogenase